MPLPQAPQLRGQFFHARVTRSGLVEQRKHLHRPPRLFAATDQFGSLQSDVELPHEPRGRPRGAQRAPQLPHASGGPSATTTSLASDAATESRLSPTTTAGAKPQDSSFRVSFRYARERSGQADDATSEGNRHYEDEKSGWITKGTRLSCTNQDITGPAFTTQASASTAGEVTVFTNGAVDDGKERWRGALSSGVVQRGSGSSARRGSQPPWWSAPSESGGKRHCTDGTAAHGTAAATQAAATVPLREVPRPARAAAHVVATDPGEGRVRSTTRSGLLPRGARCIRPSGQRLVTQDCAAGPSASASTGFAGPPADFAAQPAAFQDGGLSEPAGIAAEGAARRRTS